MKKTITILPALIMVILCVPAAGNAAGGARNSELTIELGQSPDMSGISVWVGDGKTEPEIIKQDDKTAWHIGSTVWSDENLYLNINDAIAQIFKEYEDIYLDIEYYDEKPSGVDASFFEIRYIDAGGAQARSETVWGGGTERFVTATVKLTAAQLNNSFNGSDFVLTTRSFLYGYSGKGVKISKITLRPSDTQSFVTARITTDKTGNIMYDTDKAKTFKCSVLNRSDAETEVGCTLRVLDDTGSVIETQEKAIIAQKGETAFYLDYQARRYGTFTAELTVENGNNTYTAKCPFSYNKYADGLNDRIGACVHLGYSSRDPIKTLELVSNAGIGWIRTEMHWKFYETEKGVYKLSAHQKNCLENARKNNLKLLVILAFGNSLYMENQDTSLPKTTAEKEAFYNYVYNLVTELERDYGDVVGAYELWNEPNMLSFNNDSADYVDLARYTRAAMTAAGSDKKLLGLSMTGLHSAEYCQWCTDAYDQGLGKYVDGITCHPYMEDRSPELYDLNAHIDIMHRLAKSHGASPEVWASEHGWVTTAYYGETMQAKYLVRSFLTAMSDSEFGNYFIYQFQDDGNNPYDKERQFGLLRTWSEAVVSYAAKKSYTAIANMNYQLKDLECVKHTEGAAYDSFRFEREDGNAYTEVVYNRYEADALYSPKKPKQGYSLTVYDMYGNEIKDNSRVKINGEPVYAAYKRELPKETQPPIPSVVRAEQKEMYKSVQLSGQRAGETGVDFIVLKNGKTYSDFLDNPTDSAVYFNTVAPQDGQFSDEFYVQNAAGKMNIIIHYHSDNTYEKINLDLTSRLVITQTDSTVSCTIGYDLGECDAYVAQYGNGRLKNVVRLSAPVKSIEKVSGVDTIKAFVWEKGTMKPLLMNAELAVKEDEFINAGISESCKICLEGISDAEAVGVMVYREDSAWENIQPENITGENIVYFNEIPTANKKYSTEYVFNSKSGLYRIAISDFTGAQLNNILVMYSDPAENASAMEKLLQSAKISEEEMIKTAKEYRYELSLYYPNISDDTNERALSRVYNYIKSNEITVQDSKAVSEIYNAYISDHK